MSNHGSHGRAPSAQGQAVNRQASTPKRLPFTEKKQSPWNGVGGVRKPGSGQSVWVSFSFKDNPKEIGLPKKWFWRRMCLLAFLDWNCRIWAPLNGLPTLSAVAKRSRWAVSDLWVGNAGPQERGLFDVYGYQKLSPYLMAQLLQMLAAEWWAAVLMLLCSQILVLSFVALSLTRYTPSAHLHQWPYICPCHLLVMNYRDVHLSLCVRDNEVEQ